MFSLLRSFKQVPVTGLALFVGLCVDQVTREEQVVQVCFQPPQAITRSLYRCDKVFHYDALLPLYKMQTPHGLAIIAGEDMQCYMVQGNTLQKTTGGSIGIHRRNRHKCGGMSSNRFLHQRQNQMAAFTKALAETLNDVYMDQVESGKPRVQSLVLAGSGEMKEAVAAHPSLHPQLRSAIATVLALADTADHAHALTLAQPHFRGVDVRAETSTLNRLQRMLQDSSQVDLIVYGSSQLARAASEGMVKELIIHSSVEEANESIVTQCRELGATCSVLEANTESSSLFCSGFGGIMAVLFHALPTEQADDNESA